MDFGFVGASYEAPSITQDAQECINWRPEVDPTKPQGDRGVIALYPTPGLTTKVIFQNQQEVRGIRGISGGQYMVAVCGPYVYVVTSNFTSSIIGQLTTSTGRVGITDNGVNVYIVDGVHRYTWRISNPATATFIGSVSGTTLTVTQVLSGTIAIGQDLFGVGVNIESIILSQLTGTSGGVGTYSINISQTVASTQMNTCASAASFTGSIANGVLTVTANTGTLYVGQTIYGTGVPLQTVITALGQGIVLSGAIVSGGTGYAVNDTVTVVGGVYSQPASFTISSVSGGVVTGLTISSNGQYSIYPTNNVTTTTNNAGSGLTLTLTFGTGAGGTGTYTISNSSITIGSEAMYALNFSELPNSDGAFQGADVVDTIDNYFIYNNPSTQQFAASAPLSPITPSLSFSSKDGSPDKLVSIIADHRELYLLGEASSEVWVDVGSFPFPFQRIPGTNTQHGIAAKFSVARVGNSFAYVSRNSRGQGQIMMMKGYQPDRISTHAVENTLVNQYIDDAIAWNYQLEGHEVYVVTFPTINLTWAYDVATGLWHKWLYVDNFNQYQRHRGNCSTQFQGLVMVGDWQNGKIYELDPNNYTDDGQEIRRLRRCPHLVSDLQRQYFDELQIQFQPGIGLNGISTLPKTSAVAGIAIASLAVAGGTYFAPFGVNPQAMLRWSSDGGNTWSNEHWTSIGAEGKYNNRARWRRLGWSRDRIYEVVVTDPVKAVIVSANLKGQGAEN